MLEPRDITALGAYFSDGRAQRSIQGPIQDQLERSSLYESKSPRDAGVWQAAYDRAIDAGASEERARRAAYRADREAHRLATDTEWHAPHCLCPECAPPVSARPTAESRESTREDPEAFDGRMASEKRRVGARLSVLARLDSTAYGVFALWFGDAGEKYDTSREGRINALLLLTQHGRKVLQRMLKAERGGKLGAKLKLTHQQRMENAVNATPDKMAIHTDLNLARSEASSLWNRACAAWLRTANSESIEQRSGWMSDPNPAQLTPAQRRVAALDVRGLIEFGYKLAHTRYAERASADELALDMPELQQPGESIDAYRARLIRAAAHET